MCVCLSVFECVGVWCHTVCVCLWCVPPCVSAMCTDSENADDEAAKNFWKMKKSKSVRIQLMPAEDDVVFSGDFVPQSLCFSAETFDKC